MDLAPPCPWQCVECIEDYMAGWFPDGIFEDFEGNEQTCPWDLFHEVSGEAPPAAPEPARQAPARLSGTHHPRWDPAYSKISPHSNSLKLTGQMRTVELIAYTQVTQLLEGGKRSQTRGLTPGQVVKAM